MNNYHVVMEDGHRLDLKKSSASDAIQYALQEHVGHKVKSCHLGDIHHVYITYEIPAHEPLTVKPKRLKKTEDTLAMFDAEEIRKESEYAVYRRDVDKTPLNSP